MTILIKYLFLALGNFLYLILSATALPIDIVHITDVHIDPHYSQGSIASGCYCESYANCPLSRPPSCVHTDDPSLAALMFGMPEDECASPPALWSSAMEYLSLANEENQAAFVVFTGDFGEAGLSSPCNTNQTAQDAIVENINNAMTAVRSAHPGLKVYGSFGNHVSIRASLYPFSRKRLIDMSPFSSRCKISRFHTPDLYDLL